MKTLTFTLAGIILSVCTTVLVMNAIHESEKALMSEKIEELTKDKEDFEKRSELLSNQLKHKTKQFNNWINR